MLSFSTGLFTASSVMAASAAAEESVMDEEAGADVEVRSGPIPSDPYSPSYDDFVSKAVLVHVGNVRFNGSKFLIEGRGRVLTYWAPNQVVVFNFGTSEEAYLAQHCVVITPLRKHIHRLVSVSSQELMILGNVELGERDCILFANPDEHLAGRKITAQRTKLAKEFLCALDTCGQRFSRQCDELIGRLESQIIDGEVALTTFEDAIERKTCFQRRLFKYFSHMMKEEAQELERLRRFFASKWETVMREMEGGGFHPSQKKEEEWEKLGITAIRLPNPKMSTCREAVEVVLHERKAWAFRIVDHDTLSHRCRFTLVEEWHSKSIDDPEAFFKELLRRNPHLSFGSDFYSQNGSGSLFQLFRGLRGNYFEEHYPQWYRVFYVFLEKMIDAYIADRKKEVKIPDTVERKWGEIKEKANESREVCRSLIFQCPLDALILENILPMSLDVFGVFAASIAKRRDLARDPSWLHAKEAYTFTHQFMDRTVPANPATSGSNLTDVLSGPALLKCYLKIMESNPEITEDVISKMDHSTVKKWFAER